MLDVSSTQDSRTVAMHAGIRTLLHTATVRSPHDTGRKKEPKSKLFGLDIFQWGRGLPRERVGAKKFDTSLETREIKLFVRDIPGFCRDIPGVPEKFEKKKFVFNFRSLMICSFVLIPRIRHVAMSRRHLGNERWYRCREPLDVGLAPIALWRVPPFPPWQLEDPSLKP